MDLSFCGLNAKSAKLIKNVTSNVMMENMKHDDEDPKRDVEKMRPSATTLVQRYTRNGEPSGRAPKKGVRNDLFFFFQFSINETDADLPKTVRPPYVLQKTKLSRTRSNSVRQHRNELYNNQTVFSTNEWIVKSGCHFNCIENSMGIQIVSSNLDHSTNIQLCYTEFIVSV